MATVLSSLKLSPKCPQTCLPWKWYWQSHRKGAELRMTCCGLLFMKYFFLAFYLGSLSFCSEWPIPQQGVWALNRTTWGGTTPFDRLGFNSGVRSGCFCQVIVFLLKIRKKVETMIKQILFMLSDIGNINCKRRILYFCGGFKFVDELLACESIILCLTAVMPIPTFPPGWLIMILTRVWMMILTRVVELRQLVGASTLSKGLSSHSVIRNAAKEEVRLLVMMRVP